jgi:hypothetical protein
MRNIKLYLRQVVLAVGILAFSVIALLPAQSASATDKNPTVLPPNSHAFGATYAEWNSRWWQWAVSTPASQNPVVDTTGEDCAEGQSGKVWYLAGTFGSGSVTRNCTVPTGRALFFPVINSFCAADPGTDPDPAIQRECVSKALAGARGTVEIDGTVVQNLSKYFVDPLTSPIFSLTLPPDNIFGVSAGTYSPAAAGGIYLLLAPLSAGEHLIHFEGSLDDGTTVNVTYHLVVTSHGL